MTDLEGHVKADKDGPVVQQGPIKTDSNPPL